MSVPIWDLLYKVRANYDHVAVCWGPPGGHPSAYSTTPGSPPPN